MTRPYSAASLTDDQRAEVLRVTAECAATERSAYRVHLNAERATALQQAKDHPTAADLHRASAAAYDRALALLDTCWPAPDLAPTGV